MRLRVRALRAMREFFEGQGFLEVDTPIAITAPAPELHIDAPELVLATDGAPSRRFLQASPELAMKRILSRGLGDIFQLAPVFRDGEVTAHHRPEFRLLEWYRWDRGWEILLDDCEALLRKIVSDTLGSHRLDYGGQTIDLSGPFRRITVDAAFREYAGYSILDHLERAPLMDRLTADGIPCDTDDTWDDLFHRVFLSRVEPQLLSDPTPIFVTHYPVPLASLARLSHNDPRTAERVELYVGGLELANGFGELTDPTLQRERFVAERRARTQAGKTEYPLDEAFLEDLARIEQAAGIALGWDRLLMLLMDVRDIDDVAFLPWGDA